MVFGTNALFTKPAQSLAPMIVLYILNQYGYEQLKDAGRELNPRYRQFLRYLEVKPDESNKTFLMTRSVAVNISDCVLFPVDHNFPNSASFINH